MLTAAKIINKKEDNKIRTFKVIYLDTNTNEIIIRGRFCSVKPYHAARKALTSIHDICLEKGITIDNNFKIGLYETTRCSKNNYYWYSAQIKTLDEPIIALIQLEGITKQIERRYIPIIKSISESECSDLSNYVNKMYPKSKLKPKLK